MEKFALIFLLMVVVFAFGFHFGVQNGRNKTFVDFRKQMESHKTFYEHNLKAECSKRKFVHVID